MNAKTLLTILVFTALSLPILSGMTASRGHLDEEVRDKLLLLIDDSRTGRIKQMKLSELEAIISAMAPFRTTGFGGSPNNPITLDYRFKETNGHDSDYGFSVLASGEGNNFENYAPINVRLTYFSPSGIVYYNSLILTPWPSEKQPDGVKLRLP